MQLRRITAPDARSATTLATARYGREAFILSNERIGGRVEVIVAIDNAPASAREAGPEALPAKATLPGNEAGAFADILAAVSGQNPARETGTPDAEAARARELVSLLRDEFVELRRELQFQQKLALWQPASALTPVARAWDEALMAAAAPAALRALLIGHLAQAPDLVQSFSMAQTVLAASVPQQMQPHSLEGVHALAGASGCGKTLMVARLAKAHATARGYGPDQVAMISLGDQRPGAWSQVQLLGAQVGVECFRAVDISAAASMLDELGSRRVVLIDTPGAGGREMLVALRQAQPRLVCHLVVPADVSVAALKRLTGDPDWHWDSLMISKLDEASHPWGLIQAGGERGLRISFAGAEPRASLPICSGIAERVASAAIGSLVFPRVEA